MRAVEGMRHIAEANLPDARQIVVTDISATRPPWEARDGPLGIHALEGCER